MECIQELTTFGYHIISIEQADKAIMLYDFNPKKYEIRIGAWKRSKGCNQSIVSASNTVIEIPQYGTKHSLNISVSSGVVIWDFFQKLQV